MVTGGNATVFITDMDRALEFYTKVLGMRIKCHYGNDWAEVEAGGFVVGLHPKSDKHAAPGTPGSVQVGLMVESIDTAAAVLRDNRVMSAGEIVKGQGGNFVQLTDPDRNELYLWEVPKLG